MKKKVLLLSFLCLKVEADPGISGGVMAMSAAASLKTLNGGGDSFFGLGNILSPKRKVAIEEVMLEVEENMNNNAAVKVHIVIIYDPELVRELMKLSSYQYFRDIEQLVKDYPDKIKIYEWELVAKKRLIPWAKLEYPDEHMEPLAGFIFAGYSGNRQYRAKIPPTFKKVKIILKKDDFSVDYEDKSNKNNEDDEKS
jgi:hypothetical protein